MYKAYTSRFLFFMTLRKIVEFINLLISLARRRERDRKKETEEAIQQHL